MYAMVRSPHGIQVRVTERGLPVDIVLDRTALSVSPPELAQHILGLCQQAACRAQAERASMLAAQGHSADTVRSLGLRGPA